MDIEKEKVSPVAIIVTFALHCLIFFFASTHFIPHHHIRSPYDVIHVSIPVSTAFQPHQETQADVHDLMIPDEEIKKSAIPTPDVDTERYYLPPELTLQVRMLHDNSATIPVPIRRPVVMEVYINETGGVDDITFEDKGDLTDTEEKRIIEGFDDLIFIPGTRGTQSVKSVYRIKLEVNQRIVIRFPHS